MNLYFLKKTWVKIVCFAVLYVLFFSFLCEISRAFRYYVRMQVSFPGSSFLYNGDNSAFGLLAGIVVTLCIFCISVYLSADTHKSRLIMWFHNMELLYLTVLLFAVAYCSYFLLINSTSYRLTKIIVGNFFWDIEGLSLIINPLIAMSAGLLWLSSFIYRIKNRTLTKTLYWIKFFKYYPPNRRIGLSMLLGCITLLFLCLMGTNVESYLSMSFLFGIIGVAGLGCLTFLALFLIQLWEIHFCIINPTISIDTSNDIPYVKELAPTVQALDDLKSSYEIAVDEKIKSERFKAELITNVSHDIKTPLTSIINYVDLLKNLKIQNLQFTEYVEVLDKKSARLKMLIEDLIEASKAGTGNLTIEVELINLNEIVGQIAGEFDEFFNKNNLQFIYYPLSDMALVNADGRHLWRIMENIFSNAVKYSMNGTRIYAEISSHGEKILFSLKNIAREPLGVSADTLTQQFTRGDRSRTSEGSGLGLYIAKSLADLMGAGFRIETRGDLFEVMIEF